jgi:hypothetical protein
MQILLNQILSKTINIRFIPVGKIIRRINNRNKDIKEIAIGVSDILLRKLEGIIRLSINKI